MKETRIIEKQVWRHNEHGLSCHVAVIYPGRESIWVFLDCGGIATAVKPADLRQDYTLVTNSDGTPAVDDVEYVDRDIMNQNGCLGIYLGNPRLPVKFIPLHEVPSNPHFIGYVYDDGMWAVPIRYTCPNPQDIGDAERPTHVRMDRRFVEERG